MGVHVVMGQILNARGKFGAMMWTPVLNNIVIIVTLRHVHLGLRHRRRAPA